MSEPRSYLGRYQPRQIDVEAEKRAGWRDHRILVVRADDGRLTWPERVLIEQLGAKLYGAKGHPGKRDG